MNLPNNINYLASQLSKALDADALDIFFQPKISLTTGVVIGAEVLLRVPNDELEHISTDMWIKAATDQGLMGDLTNWLVKKVINQIKKWPNPKVPLSINVPPTIFDHEFSDFVLKSLKQAGVSNSLLEIEITEANRPPNLKILSESVQYLRSKGVKVSIDDFGSGYATMQYLVGIPVDTVKIDKSFIQQAPHSSAAYMVLRSLIELAKEMEIYVICEGAETLEQLKILLKMKCDAIQGFIVSKPMASEDAIAWFAANPIIDFKKMVEI